MDMNRANKIARVVEQINRYKAFLTSLENRSYPDEFKIYYREMETCDLEPVVLDMIIEHYKGYLKDAEDELKSL